MSKFKVGDRVKAVRSLGLAKRHIGKFGVVHSISPVGAFYVRFNDGEIDWGVHSDLEPHNQVVNAEVLKADLMDAVEAGETEHSLYPMSSPARATFAKELLEKHFNLMRVPAAAAKWVEKESAA